MAYYAKLDVNKKVIAVHVLNDAVITDANGAEQEQLGVDFLSKLHGVADWKLIPYGVGVGFTYDNKRNAFIPPKPYPSWSLDNNHNWQPPTAMPSDGKMYTWNESTKAWDEG